MLADIIAETARWTMGRQPLTVIASSLALLAMTAVSIWIGSMERLTGVKLNGAKIRTRLTMRGRAARADPIE